MPMNGQIMTSTVTLPVGMTLETFALFLVLLAFCVVLLILELKQRKEMHEMDKRLRKLMRGKNAASLESEIIHLFEANDVLTESAHDLTKRIELLQQQVDTSIRKVGLIRYDAFQQMGGKLSFALCMLNEDGAGLILNSVHSQEGNYTYVKEVVDGRCETDLGTEEQQALDRALSEP